MVHFLSMQCSSIQSKQPLSTSVPKQRFDSPMAQQFRAMAPVSRQAMMMRCGARRLRSGGGVVGSRGGRRQVSPLVLASTKKDDEEKDVASQFSVDELDEIKAGGLRCAYQGVPGAYSEMAALQAYEGCEPVPCDQFEEAFQAVESWLADRAVLPAENSLGGSIHRNYDLLLRHRLHIVGEVNLPVNHCLLALPGVEVKDIKRVLSHSQALSQCEDYLTDTLTDGSVREAVYDTAGAARSIANDNIRDAAAVASSRAAELYGLNVLDSAIQDDANNITRFMALARSPNPPRLVGSYKTSIVFSLQEGPGVLFRALACFALRDIDLTKIESRPMRTKPIYKFEDGKYGEEKRFQYLFYVDFKASMADPIAQNAMSHLEEMTTYLRVLGCYPMAVENR